MNRLINKLLALLMAQLLVVAWVFWPSAEPGFEDAQQTLLDIAADDIERLLVGDEEQTVVLARQDERWVIPEYHGLPVDSGRIQTALDSLPQLTRGYPVAQSSGARQRFEVAADHYQRKLVYVSATGEETELYLGTSPGFRKVHVRVNEDAPIYSVTFNAFDLPASPAQWLDQTLLQVEQFESIQGLDYQLQQVDGQWQDMDGLAADAAASAALVNGLKSLRIIAATDIALAAILADTVAPPTLSVVSAGQQYDYRIYQFEDEYYIQRADLGVYFTISQLDYDRLLDANHSTLFPTDVSAHDSVHGSEQQESEDQAASEDGDSRTGA